MSYIESIRTDADLEAALSRIEQIIDAEAGSREEAELDALVELVGSYEAERFPKELPDPIAAIEFRLEQAGLEWKDLIPYIGSRTKVAEVLSGKRTLTPSMARSLHQGLGIPVEALLQRPAEAHDITLAADAEEEANLPAVGTTPD